MTDYPAWFDGILVTAFVTVLGWIVWMVQAGFTRIRQDFDILSKKIDVISKDALDYKVEVARNYLSIGAANQIDERLVRMNEHVITELRRLSERLDSFFTRSPNS